MKLKAFFIIFKGHSIKQITQLFLEGEGPTLNNLSLPVSNAWFSFSLDQHNYETSSSTQGNLIKRFYKRNRYGKYLITVSAIESWNKIQKQLKNMLLIDLSLNKIKAFVSNFYLKSY